MRRAIVFCIFAIFSLCFSKFGLASPEVRPPAVQGDREVTLDLSRAYGPHQEFQDIKDWKTLHITFARTPCMGWCPAYILDITGDGAVRFTGTYCVKSRGRRSAAISQEKLRTLFEAFKRADFFSLKNEYAEGIMDAPGIAITLKYDRWHKEVIDAAGTTDMPAPAALLPGLIDKSVNTAAWIGHPTAACMR